MLKPPFYVISDTHWYHKNIVKYCNRPREHEQMMITRWQRVVPWDAPILHLGDLFFGGDEGFAKFYAQISPSLTGKKYLILGNHDKRGRDYEFLGFEVIPPFSTKYRGWNISFDHYPKMIGDSKELHVHGHIHNHDYAREQPSRPGNINVSVEVMDYRPHRITRLLNKAIRAHNQTKRYRNSPRGKQRWVKNVGH